MCLATIMSIHNPLYQNNDICMCPDATSVIQSWARKKNFASRHQYINPMTPAEKMSQNLLILSYVSDWNF